ncbi:hypothetical protein, conserved [Babesia ovata]|uniref:C3H1-type domain-containing protein n=1 Tax=Babesia ovata TaxID=189622 RepID=A0A2H6KK56_9APIC|nr:uncharacterized protein BOVATA_048780 [Babesia ovata]GBE63385.1 hypothetical protein, conserved [Babesia ovata]
MHLGDYGFRVCIDHVSDILSEYDKHLNEKTNAVNTSLSELSTNLSNQYVTQVNEKINEPLEKQLTAWRTTVQSLETEVNKIQTEKINVLDTTLKSSVLREFVPVKSVVEHMRSVSLDPNLMDQAKRVDGELLKTKAKLDAEIAKQSITLQQNMIVQFNRVENSILILKRNNAEHFKKINDSVKEARQLIDQVDGTYKSLVTWHFDELKKEVNKVQDALFKKKAELEVLVDQARTAFETLKEKVQVGTNGTADSIEYNWTQLQMQIQNLVRDVKGNTYLRDGLQGIVDGVKTYAKGFEDKTTFGLTVQDWIKKTLERKIIIQKLNAYVSGGNSGRVNFQMNEYNIGRITTVIKQYLKTQIEDAVNVLKTRIQFNLDETEITRHVNAVQSVCSAFAESLEPEITDTAIPAYGVVSGIESQLRNGGIFINTSRATSDPNLTETVKLILSSLVATAQLVGGVVHSFTSDAHAKLGKNVDETKTKVELIGKYFDKNDDKEAKALSTEDFGKKIDDALKVVNAKTTVLDNIIKNSSGTLHIAVGNLQAVFQKLEQMKNGEDTKDDTINAEKKKAGAKMQQLKNDLDEKFYALELTIARANETLTQAIKNVQTALLSAREASLNEVDKLRKNLLETTEQAFKKVTIEVKILFANSHKADLKALNALVEKHKNIIETILKNDKLTGLKGLLKKLNDSYASARKLTDLKDQQNVESLSQKLQEYLDNIFMYVLFDLPKHLPSSPYSPQLQSIHTALTTLLSHLSEKKHFDHQVPGMLAQLKTSVESLHSTNFGNPAYPVLDAFPKSLERFVEQLDKAYVNRYSGKTYNDDESHMYAKVLLTNFYTLHEEINTLHKGCMRGGEWENKKCCENERRRENPLGAFMKRCGFQVAKDEDSKDGELKYPSDLSGKQIHEKLLAKTFAGASNNEHLKNCESNTSKKPAQFNSVDLVDCLLHHVDKYSELRHLVARPKPRHPCNVYEMLMWCTGLTYNPVYSTMLDMTLTDMFADSNKADAGDGISATDLSAVSVDAYPENITYDTVRKAVTDMCSISYDVLCTVVGHGDAFTNYAIDFCTNSTKLYYPGSGEDCLKMLLEILRRMLPPLKFMYSQCGLNSQCSGWSQCQYGKDILPSNWPCDEHPGDESSCRPRSPLMSYLNDCLPGHLPHEVSSIGCKSACKTCPKSPPGMPCLTPLGFRGFSGSTRTGKELSNVLSKIISNKLAALLSCLLPKAPKTLPEHFGFALSLVSGWNGSAQASKKHLIQDALSTSISEASIYLHDQPSDFTDALRNTYGSSQNVHNHANHNHTSADLSSLSMEQSCDNQPCAPYLRSLSSDSYTRLAEKHKNVYLSWATYLPWTLHQYLKTLLDEFQQISCRDWGCRRCQHGNSYVVLRSAMLQY